MEQLIYISTVHLNFIIYDHIMFTLFSVEESFL